MTSIRTAVIQILIVRCLVTATSSYSCRHPPLSHLFIHRKELPAYNGRTSRVGAEDLVVRFDLLSSRTLASAEVYRVEKSSLLDSSPRAVRVGSDDFEGCLQHVRVYGLQLSRRDAVCVVYLHGRANTILTQLRTCEDGRQGGRYAFMAPQPLLTPLYGAFRLDPQRQVLWHRLMYITV